MKTLKPLISQAVPDTIINEKHFSVPELVALWGYSDDTIIRHFKNEDGVIAVGTEETMHGRGKKTLRIPESVAIRVHQSLRVKPPTKIPHKSRTKGAL